MESSLHFRIQHLGDLELALLVALVAQEHCIFSTPEGNVGDLRDELRLTCTQMLGKQAVVVNCSPQTTVDEFNHGLLVEADEDLEDHKDHDMTRSRPALSTVDFSSSGAKRIADVIIAVDLDAASDNVQIQAFELLRSRRIFTRSAMHMAPKDLLFLTVLSRPGTRLYRHLNDVFCMSHYHGDEDGFPRLESGPQDDSFATFMPSDLRFLREQMDKAFMTAEMAQYLHNIVVFMRNSRYVKGGTTATATRQMRLLTRALAALHGLDYVPPSLVGLAARKIYPHRLVLATAENERSLLWGSEPAAIKSLLQDMTVESVIEEVLASIETPL